MFNFKLKKVLNIFLNIVVFLIGIIFTLSIVFIDCISIQQINLLITNSTQFSSLFDNLINNFSNIFAEKQININDFINFLHRFKNFISLSYNSFILPNISTKLYDGKEVIVVIVSLLKYLKKKKQTLFEVIKDSINKQYNYNYTNCELSNNKYLYKCLLSC